MNAKIGTYDPEKIDQDVTTYYRNITKLERTFMKNIAPLTIAKTVILNFKLYNKTNNYLRIFFNNTYYLN